MKKFTTSAQKTLSLPKAEKLKGNPIGVYTNQFWDILRTVVEIGEKYFKSHDSENLHLKETR